MILIACLVLGACHRLNPPGAATGSILFTYVDSNVIAILDLSTGDVREIPTPFNGIQDATWTPDGEHIIFSGKHKAMEIYEMDRNGHDLHRLFHRRGAEVGAEMSPDGTRIAFAGSTEWPNTYHKFSIFVAKADGSEMRRISHGTGNHRPTWSPDGRRIAFETGRSLRIADLDEDRVGPEFAQDADFPDWAPDKPLLTATSARTQGVLSTFAIQTFRPDGTDRRVLTDYDPFFLSPTWSPDGDYIVMTGNHDVTNDECDIFMMRADGSDLSQITHTSKCEASLDWAPAI